MALRRFHCYGCERQFGSMININGNNEVKCNACGSDFVEEITTALANQAEEQRAPQQPEQALPSMFDMQPIPQQQSQMPMQQHMVQQSMMSSVSNGQQPRGYTRSVTVSYGNGMGQPQVQMFDSNSGGQPELAFPSINFNNTNNIQMNVGRGHQDLNQMLQGMFAGGRMFFVSGDQQPQTRGVSEEYLNNLPPMAAEKQADCNICLEKVGSNNNESCELPCGHAFDKTCLSTWLKEHDSCPVCRSKLDQERENAQPNIEQQQQRQQPMFNPFQGFFGF